MPRKPRPGITAVAGVSLSVTPNPGVAGLPYTVTGSGLTDWDFGDGILHVSAADPGCCKGFAVAIAPDGSFSYTDTANGPGVYVLNFLGVDDQGNVKTVGTVTFPVQ